jgi:hypothetical protein
MLVDVASNIGRRMLWNFDEYVAVRCYAAPTTPVRIIF